MYEISTAHINPADQDVAKVKPEHLPFFEFDDEHLDKVFRLGPMTVDENEISILLPMRQLREELQIGESVRLPSFSVNQSDPCLGGWRFELRLYPSGQYGSPEWFSVYLVLIECPYDQHSWAATNIFLTVKSLPQSLILQDSKFKLFDWSHKPERWIRLGVPLGQIKYRSRLSLSVTILTEYNSSIKKQVNSKINKKSIKARFFEIFKKKGINPATKDLTDSNVSIPSRKKEVKRRPSNFQLRSLGPIPKIIVTAASSASTPAETDSESFFGSQSERDVVDGCMLTIVCGLIYSFVGSFVRKCQLSRQTRRISNDQQNAICANANPHIECSSI